MTRMATAKALSNLERHLNTIFNSPIINAGATRTEDLGFAGYGPAIDIFEDAEGFYLAADVPGFSQENLQIRFENHTLTLSGERRPTEANNLRFHRTESFSGRFQRSFSLTDEIDVEKIEAELKNGVLTILLPKQEQSKPRQITVKVN